MKNIVTLGLIIASMILAGCQTKPPADAFKLSSTSLENRQIQTRLYETQDEVALLSAGVAVLQDMGYTLDESEKTAGLIAASKTVDAATSGQVAVALTIALLGGGSMPIDSEQKVKVSLVTIPSKTSEGYLARVTFQRIVWNTDGIVSKAETLNETSLYEEFFDKLSKSVFLEGHRI